MILLDVNVLVALSHSSHQFHRQARAWRTRLTDREWASTEITQSAFVRLSANPTVVNPGRTPLEAYQLLQSNIASKHHRFLPWKAPKHLPEILRRCQGYRQVPGAYLIALALEYECRFATFDQKLKHLSPDPPMIEAIPLL